MSGKSLKGTRTEKNLLAAFAGESQARNRYDFFGGGVEIQAAYPAGKIDDTLSNLEAAADGEKEEWGVLYPGFAETAREEGFPDVALVFTEIAKVEAYHERRYRKLAANIKEGTVFKRGAAARWKCNNCGYVHEGPEAPEICPACAHPRAYYELWVEAY
jgi:rubrerythrin